MHWLRDSHYQVTQVFSIENDTRLRHWHVETAIGLKTLRTFASEEPRRLKNGLFVLRDLQGDQYFFSQALMAMWQT